MKVEEFNALEEQEAVELLQSCADIPTWAAAVAGRRPYASATDLTTAPYVPMFRDYRVPQMGDIPFATVLLADTIDALGPRGAKSMSEAPYNPVAPALANAVRAAIGVRPYEIPMSKDRIWRLLHPTPPPEAR